MSDINFDKFDNDVKIMAVGSLFRLIDGNQWKINIHCIPKKSSNWLTMSNAPVIISHSILNRTAEGGSTGWKSSFTITDTDTWQVKKLGDFPRVVKVNPEVTKQFCFVFRVTDNTTVYLPQFELARALFFHDGYLSRTALEPSCLAVEFDVSLDGAPEKAVINVMPSAGYTLKHFDEPSCRRMLSWILLDPHARKSYESIGQFQKQYGYDKGRYRMWNFQFEPPPMPFARFNIRGKFDAESNSLFVYEIEGIGNLKADLPDSVEIRHPDFEVKIANGAGQVLIGEGQQSPVRHDIHEVEANSDRQPHILRSKTIDIQFDKAFKTCKMASKKRLTQLVKMDNQADEGGSISDVSVEEGSIVGELPGADWNNVNDITDDLANYTNKFTCFLGMIDRLVSHHGCEVKSNELRKLPFVPGHTKHLLKPDDFPRCLAVVELIADGRHFHILEIETSDGDKPLSTQVLRLIEPESWKKNLETLEVELVTRSLCWPISFLHSLSGEGCQQGVSHPKTQCHNKGFLETASIHHWGERFYFKITER